MKKRTLCLFLCCVFVVTMFCGCSSKATEASEEKAPEIVENAPAEEKVAEETPAAEIVDPLREDEGTTITLAHNQGEYIYEKFYEMGNKFEELTGIKIEWIEVASEEWSTWITAQMAAGTEPDIFFNMPSSDDAMDYFDQGKLADLTDWFEKENVFNGKKLKDCFSNGAFNDCMSNDGTRQISSTLSYVPWYLYYNKDIMQELNLGTEPPKNFSEMIEMMKVAKEDGRYVPMSAMNSMRWSLIYLDLEYLEDLFYETDLTEKVDIIIPNGRVDSCEAMLALKSGAVRYTDPRIVEYFTKVKELTQYWNEDFNSASWEYEGLFNDGKAMFNINGSWFPGQAVENGCNINYGIAKIPYVDSEYSQFGLGDEVTYAYPFGISPEPALYVSKRCEDEGRMSAAVKALMFFADAKTGAQMYCDAVGCISAIQGVEIPEIFSDINTFNYGTEVYNCLDSLFRYASDEKVEYWELYTAYLDPASTMSAEEFTQQLEAEIMPYLDDAIEEYTTYDILSYLDKVS